MGRLDRADNCACSHTHRPNLAVFLDRDGVINEERGYVYQPDAFILLRGVISSLLKLEQAGFRLVVITNQAGIARGYYGEEEYTALLEHIRDLLTTNGMTIAGFYHCPDHPVHGRGDTKPVAPVGSPSKV